VGNSLNLNRICSKRQQWSGSGQQFHLTHKEIAGSLYAINAITYNREVHIMAKTVTTRLDDGYVKKIDEMAARKGVDRSALLRSFFLYALKEHTIRDALEDYKAGTTTL